jgi:hypothetical protein
MTKPKSSSFISRFDQYMLKNYPVTWSTRIFTAGLFAVGFLLLLILISFIVPNEPRDSSQVQYWITLLIVISLLAFIFWMIYLLRFNVFKRFGEWKNTDSLKTFIFYFLIILVIISWIFVPPVVESVRANTAYSTNELAQDINAMNIKLNQLESDSIDTRFQSDTFEIDNSKIIQSQRVDRVPAPPSLDTNEVVTETTYRDNYYYIDTTLLKAKLADADSVTKITDSIYVVYECPNFRFIHEYEVASKSELSLTSMDLYRQVLKYKQPIDKEKVRKELGQLFVKYDRFHNPVTLTSSLSYNYDYYKEKNYETRISEKYDLAYVNRSLDNIADKMYRWDSEVTQISWRLAYYLTLCLAMLVFIYRHTTRRTFFLSLLASVILSILTGLFVAAGHGSDNAFLIWMLIYFISFIVISAFIIKSKNRNVVSGIALNLLVFMTPFMPLVITALYYESLRDKYNSYVDPVAYNKLFENEYRDLFLSEIGGALLLLILLGTLYQQAYKKWFALPEQ